MKIPQKTLERKLLNSGYNRVIGVDEVGMGCLAGPVVVCAAALGKNFFCKSHPRLHGLRDSKLLLPVKREEFARELFKEKNLQFKIAYCYPKTIDKINIYQAARKAMRRAVKKLNYELGIRNYGKEKELKSHNSRFVIHNSKTVVLVDGPSRISGLPETIHQVPIIKGDQKVFSIACASVLAKVFRDKMMVKYAKKFPGYGFEKHKGYGTKEHLNSLASQGPCSIHRKSFSPVAKVLELGSMN